MFKKHLPHFFQQDIYGRPKVAISLGKADAQYYFLRYSKMDVIQ